MDRSAIKNYFSCIGHLSGGFFSVFIFAPVANRSMQLRSQWLFLRALKNFKLKKIIPTSQKQDRRHFGLFKICSMLWENTGLTWPTTGSIPQKATIWYYGNKTLRASFDEKHPQGSARALEHLEAALDRRISFCQVFSFAYSMVKWPIAWLKGNWAAMPPGWLAYDKTGGNRLEKGIRGSRLDGKSLLASH